MSDTAKRKGRPKGREKQALTIRLDSDLYELIKAYEKLVLEQVPSAKVVDIHEAIYHAFFFTYKGQALQARDAGEAFKYLISYVDAIELRSMERFDYLRTLPAPEQVSSWLSAYQERKQEREEYQRQRLEELKQKHETLDTRALQDELERIKKRLAVLEKGE